MTLPDTREDILSLAGSTLRLDEDRPALLVIEKPDGSCIEIKPGAHSTYGEALAICRLLADALTQAWAAPTPPAAEAPGQEPVAVKGVDSQVMVAAKTLSHEQKLNPQWLWYAGETLSFGRWHNLPAQAPYVRADLIVSAPTKQEPVAWRDEPEPGFWMYSETQRSFKGQPLYLAPPTYADAEAMGWQTIDSAPKDGSIVWAWLYQTGIRAVRWGSAEEWAERDGGSPDEYEACWVQADDDDEVWSPKWWLPYDAIGNPEDDPAIRSLASPAPKGET